MNDNTINTELINEQLIDVQNNTIDMEDVCTNNNIDAKISELYQIIKEKDDMIEDLRECNNLLSMTNEQLGNRSNLLSNDKDILNDLKKDLMNENKKFNNDIMDMSKQIIKYNNDIEDLNNKKGVFEVLNQCFHSN